MARRFLLGLALSACGGASRTPDAAAPRVDAPISDAMTVDGSICDINCEQPIVCPVAAVGQISICGRIFDLETSKPLECIVPVDVHLFDEHLMPIVTGMVDGCARFVMVAPYQVSGSVIVGTDDRSGGADDLYRPTIVGMGEPASGGTLNGAVVFATRVSTDQMWTTSSGPDPALAGETFAEHGVFVSIFVDPLRPKLSPLSGTPAAGVEIQAGGASDAAHDFYFSDADPLMRTTIAPAASSSGANGTGLFIDGSLMMYGGAGGEPAPCVWPTRLAATPQGFILVEQYAAQAAGGGACM